MTVGIGVVSSAIILAALYLLTASLDSFAYKGSNEKLSIVLNEWTRTLVLSAEDHTFLNRAFASVANETRVIALSDLQGEKSHLGSFDWIAILDSNGVMIHSDNLPEGWAAARYFSSDGFRPILDRVNAGQFPEALSVGGAFESDGVQFLAVTTRIKPDKPSDADAMGPPFFVGGRNLDQAALHKIASQIGSDDLFFVPEGADRSVLLEGPTGIVGNIALNADLPGSQFRRVALPWVLAICVALILLTAWMAVYFRKLATSLEQMHEVAMTDHLTGAANRTALTETLQTALLRQSLQEGNLAVISLDLNDFKKLNDDYGHHAGDRALQISAERIKSSVRRYEKVYRMGGDEFLCIVFDPDPAAAAQRVFDRLSDVFSKPMDLGPVKQRVTPSVGIAIAQQGETWGAILKRSDEAMYSAKRGREKRCA